MATKQETINLVDIFKEFNQDKSIGTQTLITVLEDSFKSVISKMYGPSADYTIIVNPDKGDLEIYRNRLVMEDGDVANPDTQISLSDARLLDEEAEVGDDVTDQVSLASFGITICPRLPSFIVPHKNFPSGGGAILVFPTFSS